MKRNYCDSQVPGLSIDKKKKTNNNNELNYSQLEAFIPFNYKIAQKKLN